jgi:methionyl-tRNA formyltransferase
MRILLFANNRLGARAANWLASTGTEIAGIVLHPPARRTFGDEIAAAAPNAPVFDAAALDDSETLNALEQLDAQVGLSVMFGYILRAPVLDLFPQGCLNLHPALLPFNRGAFPNVWPILDGSPAGTTIHYVDEGIDTGDVVAQRQVSVEPIDTSERLYEKLEDASFELLRDTWPAICEERATRTPQPDGIGSVHRRSDVESIDEIELDRRYSGRELIDLLRARTFDGQPGAFVVRDGRKIFLRLDLTYADE